MSAANVRDRRGIALLATLGAISLLGLLALTSVRVARARQVGARRITAIHAAALETARLLDSAVSAAHARDWARVAPGVAQMLRSSTGEQLLLHRLQSHTFRLDAAVQRGDAVAPARHAASLLVRADAPRLDRGAPLVVASALIVASDFRLDGTSSDAACALVPGAPLVLAADSAVVRWEDPGMDGVVREDGALRDGRVFQRDVARLRAAAQLTLDAGAHYAPAGDSTRTILALGDLTLGPGAARGALLVLGRLSIVGPLRFDGSIIALGGIGTAGPGIALIGTVTSMGATRLSGGSLRYDSCAATAASLGAATLEPLRRWGYATVW